MLSRASEHPRYSVRADEMPTTRPGFIAVPLRHGALTGALLVAGREARPLGPEERDLLVQLGSQAAAAIGNAMFHEQALNFFIHTSDMLVDFLDRIDVFYPGHSRGVAALANGTRAAATEATRRTAAIRGHAPRHRKAEADPRPPLRQRPGPRRREGVRSTPAGVESAALSSGKMRPSYRHHERWEARGTRGPAARTSLSGPRCRVARVDARTRTPLGRGAAPRKRSPSSRPLPVRSSTRASSAFSWPSTASAASRSRRARARPLPVRAARAGSPAAGRSPGPRASASPPPSRRPRPPPGCRGRGRGGSWTPPGAP